MIFSALATSIVHRGYLKSGSTMVFFRWDYFDGLMDRVVECMCVHFYGKIQKK
jgi:hypothetical protein